MRPGDIAASVKKRERALCALADEIWGFAETAFAEQRSAKALGELLEREGFSVQFGIAGIETAFCASFGEGEPCIGLLGEYDALFSLSQKAGAFAREWEIESAPGHGCGHHLLGVGALGAALAVKDYLQKSGALGRVVYFGCPGEEGGSGKAFMAREGVFDALDAALTWHPGSLNMVAAQSSLANIQAAYHFTGLSAHAAADPHNGRSALDAVELLNIGVQFLREHMIPEARVHYAITDAGGLSPNVVQANASALYLIRAPRNDQAKELFDRVSDIARGAALMTQTSLEVRFVKACSNIVPNSALQRLLHQCMKKATPPVFDESEWVTARRYEESCPAPRDNVEKYGAGGGKVVACFEKHAGQALCDYLTPYFELEGAAMGSSDVGDVSWVCPTAQCYTTTWAMSSPGHSWQIVAQGKLPAAHKGMLYAARALAGTAIALIEQPDALERAREEHRKRVGKGYVCPIPKGVKPQPITGKM